LYQKENKPLLSVLLTLSQYIERGKLEKDLVVIEFGILKITPDSIKKPANL
jgi:hypothetical protein